MVEGRCRLRQAMIRDKRMNELYLIPAAQTRDKSALSPSDMVRICDELRPEFDWILIDSPAGIERGFRNVIAPADVILVVTNPEVSAVRDADRIIGLIEAEEKGPARLIINVTNDAWFGDTPQPLEHQHGQARGYVGGRRCSGTAGD